MTQDSTSSAAIAAWIAISAALIIGALVPDLPLALSGVLVLVATVPSAMAYRLIRASRAAALEASRASERLSAAQNAAQIAHLGALADAAERRHEFSAQRADRLEAELASRTEERDRLASDLETLRHEIVQAAAETQHQFDDVQAELEVEREMRRRRDTYDPGFGSIEDLLHRPM